MVGRPASPSPCANVPSMRCATAPGVFALAAQNAEVEEMRSSMEHMRTIVQIQAQIDSCLVDGGENELLLSSSLEGGAGGEPDPRLVKQAIRLLRVRHRVLRVRIENLPGNQPLPESGFMCGFGFGLLVRNTKDAPIQKHACRMQSF